MSSLFPEEHHEEQQEEFLSIEQPISPSIATEVVTESDTPIAAGQTPSPASQLPPEAQGETHGGPLGCCLGTVVGIFLTALIITGSSIALTNGGFLSFATIPFLFLGTILGGYFGWRIGKRIYKEYEPPVIKERLYPQRTKVKSKARRVS